MAKGKKQNKGNQGKFAPKGAPMPKGMPPKGMPMKKGKGCS